jgi:hypothetical protein
VDGTTTTTTAPPVTTGDQPTTMVDPDSSSTAPDDSTSGPPPDPTTGVEECPNAPDGSYNDCVNGAECDGNDGTCISDDPEDPSFGICSLRCEDDCDCFRDPGDGDAHSICAPILDGEEKACALDCSGGESCPPGAYCYDGLGICVFGLEGPPVRQLPDLYFEYFHVEEHAYEPGAPAVMHYEIANGGAVDAVGGFQLRVIVSENDFVHDGDDVVIHQEMYPDAIEAGGSDLWDADLTIPVDLYDGVYNIFIAVDPTGVIEEAEEGNNVEFDPDTITIFNNPMPMDIDLDPTSASAVEHQVFQGDATSFNFGVKNLGADASPAYSVGLYYSVDTTITTADTLICTHTDVGGLAGMGQEAHQIACDVPPLVGVYHFGVIVDPMNVLGELDETNNVAFDLTPVNIDAGDIDLQMGSVVSGDNTVDTGQLVTVSATVSNTGPDPAPVFGVRFYLSSDANITLADDLVCEAVTAAPLVGGDQVVVSKICTIPDLTSGAYYLGAIADPSGQVAETDETDNDGASVGPLQVTAP